MRHPDRFDGTVARLFPKGLTQYIHLGRCTTNGGHKTRQEMRYQWQA